MKEVTVVRSNESGEIMIESTIIVLMTTFILIFLVSLGFLLYQKSIINTVANETASEIAQTYKYTGILDKDISSQQEMLSAIDGIKKYRYVFSWGSLEADNAEKAETYSIGRLSRTSFASVQSGPTIQVNAIKSDIGRRYIEVTLEARYSIFWGGALKAFGMEDAYVISSTAYAECNDISSYYNTVKFTKYACSKIDEPSAFVGAVNSMMSLFKGIFG